MHLDHQETFPERHTYSAAGPVRADGTRRALRIGLGGPVGT
ncbi:urease accessory protein UreG, partial [Streptomyces sp. NPDC050636]